ncbi:tyrosine-protein phosphatase non-receptor type 21-like isoform X2 [Littorina saxatilis]|uniref:tyrosine-protein phosphatase non-receptor type 21-like isoform X2 n=1 Tax=Littorina saxatilis TaxID=31220 RepID=UPI0038B523C7
MPFKWRLKKTRSYEISSKNSFIVGVYLLDNSFLECTLNSDSTGQECLDSIAQRIELSETCYFGLRFVTKKLQFHWADLDRPLKRQLDKYAQPSSHPHCLYFGVMFYVAGAHRISDDVARYHYYLQLKNDIVDGRLPCSVEQAVRLAAFSLQAEFGDHEQEKFTADYFKEYPLLPKNMTKDETTYADLLHEVFSAHASLQGLPAARAELQYIKDVQLMDGYGCDFYVAKDESRKDLYLGTSYAGVFVRYLDGQPTVYYRWPEIARLNQNKKVFEVETSKSSAQFQMEDTETAKYVHRLGQLQHRFYKSNRANLRDNQQMQITPVDSSQELAQSQTSLVYLQEQRAQQGETPQAVAPEEYYRHSQQSLDSVLSEIQQQQLQQQQQQQQQQQLQHSQNNMMVDGNVYNVSTTPQGSTTPTPQMDPVYANRAAMLPAYRPSPDYDIVMQTRRIQVHMQESQQQPHQHQQQNLGQAQVYTHPEGISYSQPEIRQSSLQPVYDEGNYVNAAAIRSYNHNIYAMHNIHDAHNYYALRGGVGAGGERGGGNLTSVHTTYSSPELNVQPPQGEQFTTTGSGSETLITTDTLAYHFRPPPPYPRTSTSTPDLASQAMGSPSDPTDLASSNPALSAAALDSGSPSQSGAEAGSDVLAMAGVPPAVSEGGVTGDALLAPNLAHLQVVDSPGAVDQDDTSSEHSYTTFHAKESDESSDDACKLSQRESQSQIHIRMLGPKEAPPQSKTKEVATLRESFRRMMIARSGSIRGSRKSFRESSEPKPATDPVNLTPVSEQPSDTSITSQQSTPASDTSTLSETHVYAGLPVPCSEDSSSEMQEILEKLGDPPPYPGNKPPMYTSPQELVPDLPPRERLSIDLAQVVPPPSSVSAETVMAVLPPTGGGGEREEKHAETHSMAESSSEADSGMPHAEEEEEEERRSRVEEEDPGVESGSDTDSIRNGTGRQMNMGPLKMAAMNGLTLSHSVVMALMNDESRAPKDERRKILESKISDGQVFMEFEEIPKKAAHQVCNVAKASHNQSRNRFKDVLPYDATRVKLTTRKDNPDGYVNASHIKLSAAHMDWWFVATQAPLPDTTQDFWQMIWEQEVDVIAMLTAFQELGKQKCFVYWPQETGSQHIHKYGDFEVELQFMHDSLCYLTSGIMVRHMPSRKEKMVWHLQYTDWPDHGCPEDTYGFLGFLDEIESVSRLAESEEGSGKKSPVVIHCSAGVGRTGVVILTMVMKWCLEHNHSVDLPRALTGIRNQRMHMVQTLAQYQFIHDTLIQYLKNTRLI